MTVPLVTSRGIAAMRRMQTKLFQAGLAEADPSTQIVLSRYNRTTAGWDDLAPQEVLVRYFGDKGMLRRLSSDLSTPLATSPTAIEGIFTAFEPFDVLPGDRFDLHGLAGHVMSVWPARNGKRRASFVIETDQRTGP